MTFQEIFEKVLESDLDLDAEVLVAPLLPFPDAEEVKECYASSEDGVIVLYY